MNSDEGLLDMMGTLNQAGTKASFFCPVSAKYSVIRDKVYSASLMLRM